MEIAGVIIAIVALIVAYKLVEFCFARFPLQYSIFLLVLIVINHFVCLAMTDFWSVFAVEFLFAFFYITQVQANDYDTVESTTSYSSWRDAYVTTHQTRHHHTPGWVRKLIFMAIFAAISALVGIGWSMLAVSIAQAILPAIRGITAFVARRRS